MKENIERLLKSKLVSNYTISKETGIAQSTISGYATGANKIGNMKLDHALLLNDYYTKNWKEKVEEMENIKQIIAGIENGKVEVDNEASYEDVNGVEYVAHSVEGHEDLEVLFGKREDANEVDPNELDDVYNYDTVTAYRMDGGEINWI